MFQVPVIHPKAALGIEQHPLDKLMLGFCSLEKEK
jgi:hypothetical protein